MQPEMEMNPDVGYHKETLKQGEWPILASQI